MNIDALFYTFLLLFFIEIVLITQYFGGNLASGMFYITICTYLIISFVYLILTGLSWNSINCKKISILLVLLFFVFQLILVGIFSALFSVDDMKNYGVTRVVVDTTDQYICQIRKFMNFISVFFYIVLVLFFLCMSRIYKSGYIGEYTSVSGYREKLNYLINNKIVVAIAAFFVLMITGVIVLAAFSFNLGAGTAAFLISYTTDLLKGSDMTKYSYGCEKIV